MRKGSAVSSVLALAALVLAGTTVLAGDAWLGSWNYNAAKSKTASAAMRAQTLKFEPAGDAVKLSMEGTDAAGKAMKGGFTSKFDGTDVPWPGNPVADTASPKRVDDHSYVNVWKKGGKAVMNGKVEVSKDGKTLTVTQTPVDGSTASVAVYDKQ